MAGQQQMYSSSLSAAELALGCTGSSNGYQGFNLPVSCGAVVSGIGLHQPGAAGLDSESTAQVAHCQQLANAAAANASWFLPEAAAAASYAAFGHQYPTLYSASAAVDAPTINSPVKYESNLYSSGWFAPAAAASVAARYLQQPVDSSASYNGTGSATVATSVSSYPITSMPNPASEEPVNLSGL